MCRCSSELALVRLGSGGCDVHPEAPAGILNHFWIQVAVLLLKRPHGGFRRVKRP
jgi:hypothetical protein